MDTTALRLADWFRTTCRRQPHLLAVTVRSTDTSSTNDIADARAQRDHRRAGAHAMKAATRAAVVIALVATTVVGQLPARAHHEPLIQPGSAAWPAHTPLGQWGPCTLNFVFRDARHTYIGTAARCTYEVGERVTMADREFGTVVHIAYSGPTEDGDVPAALADPASFDDFALIRVDDSEVHRVSPVVLDIGRAPHGVTTSDMTADGNLLFMTGQGAGLSQRPTRHRLGVLVSDDAQGFRASFPVTLGDAGAPVLDGNNHNAYGVLTTASPYGGTAGTTIERILHLLETAGFRVELVTAWDERVRRGSP